MIYKNVKYGNIEDVTVVEFGNGTLNLVDREHIEEGSRSILIKQQDIKEIGLVGPKVDIGDDFKPDLVLFFKNREGFEVFKEYVDNVYNGFLEIPSQVNSCHGTQLEIQFPD